MRLSLLLRTLFRTWKSIRIISYREIDFKTYFPVILYAGNGWNKQIFLIFSSHKFSYMSNLIGKKEVDSDTRMLNLFCHFVSHINVTINKLHYNLWHFSFFAFALISADYLYTHYTHIVSILKKIEQRVCQHTTWLWINFFMFVIKHFVCLQIIFLWFFSLFIFTIYFHSNKLKV